MKKLDEMSHEEIAALTDEQIDTLVDMECAKQGVAIIDKPAEPNALKVDSNPDLAVYTVGGFVFTEPGPAAEVAALLKEHQGSLVKSDYEWAAGHNNYYANDYEEKVEVTPGHILSWKKFQEIRGDLQVAETTRGDYTKEQKKWQEGYDQRAKIRKDILLKIKKHKEAEDDYQRYHAVMARYVELSDGDKKIALKFFEEAHKDDEKAQALKPRLCGEFGLMLVDNGRLVRGETAA